MASAGSTSGVREPREEPVPDSASFGRRRRSILLFVVPAALLLAGPVLVPGAGFVYLRAVTFLGGLLCLRAALMRWAFRVRMNPDGILVTGEPGIPWAAIHDCRILSVTIPRRGGFEFQYTGPEGKEGKVHVPGNLERGGEVFRTFLALAERHGSPWSAVEGLRQVRSLGRTAEEE